MKRTIVGLFKSRTQAERALREIETSGYASSEISLVMPNISTREMNSEYSEEISGVPEVGMMHDFDSFLVQAPVIELPQIGHVTAAGPLSGILLRKDVSLHQALIYYGVGDEQAMDLENAVANGKLLAIIETDNSKAAKVANTLAGYGASSVEKWSKNNDKPLHQWNAD